MWLSGVCRRGYLDWIYSLTFLQPTRVPKIPIFLRDGAKVFRLFRWNIEKILYCFFIIKASGGALLSTSVWMGSSPSLGINLNHLFLLEQHLFECTRDLLFPTKLLNDSSSCAPSNHKTSEALSTQRLDGAHHFFFCLPRSYQHNVTHIWNLLLPIHPNISQNWTFQKFSWFSWWRNLFFYSFCETDDHYPFHK